MISDGSPKKTEKLLEERRFFTRSSAFSRWALHRCSMIQGSLGLVVCMQWATPENIEKPNPTLKKLVQMTFLPFRNVVSLNIFYWSSVLSFPDHLFQMITHGGWNTPFLYVFVRLSHYNVGIRWSVGHGLEVEVSFWFFQCPRVSSASWLGNPEC